MHAIGLKGPSNVGKSQTLNLLIDLLQVATTSCIMPVPQPKGKDRREIFYYKDFIVGVATAGDNKIIVDRNCFFFNEHNCNFVFSATRTKGESVDSFKNFVTKRNAKLNWVKRERNYSTPDDYAMLQAQELFNMIK